MFLLTESDLRTFFFRSVDERDVEAVTVANEWVEEDNYPLDASFLTYKCVASLYKGG